MSIAKEMDSSASHDVVPDRSDGHAHDADSQPAKAGEAPAPIINSTAPTPTPNRRPTNLIPRSGTFHSAKDKDSSRGASKTSAAAAATVGLDPLSTQIFLRANSNVDLSLAQRLRNPTRAQSPPPPESANEASTNPANGSSDMNRERRKGPSILSRLGALGTWKKDESIPDSDSERGEARTDGIHARAMTSLIPAGAGFIPLHKEPPRYIRVKAYNKRTKDFNRLFLAQELLGPKPCSPEESQRRAPATAVGNRLLKAGDAIWAAEFSLDGRYLAVAGKDQVVRVFSVISTPEERQAHEEEEARLSRCNGERLSAPVFRSKPTHEFQGHTGEVLALSWSKNNFLLSSSMDKTVKLWHLSRKESICSFQHTDLVTSIAFHPTDDRFFLAGSLDAQLRLWSIPDKAVAFSANANEFITAVAFSPDGKTAICGVLSGLCIFYETEGLKSLYHLHARSSRGRNAKGSKVTGIRTTTTTSTTEGGETDVRVLISTNDSRVRIYSLKTRMLEVKLKGLTNHSSMIHARFSDDGRYVISGSEDRRAYIWGTNHPEAEMKDKQPYECFVAHPEVVTTALMAPVKSRLLLSASGDPIYDLCNPPPVQLLSLEEKTASQLNLSNPEAAGSVKRPGESPAYLERSKHMDGSIIITSDRTGTIKVFRQDCAYAKRQQNMWETGSRFSGKLHGIGRSASIMTRNSGSSFVRSGRESLSIVTGPAQVQPASDRIVSWRQDMENRASISEIAMANDRSASPLKPGRGSFNAAGINAASEARRLPYASSPPAVRSPNPTSPTGSVHPGRSSARLSKETARALPVPSFNFISAPDVPPQEERKDNSFWNLSRWSRGIPGFKYSLSGPVSKDPVDPAAAGLPPSSTTPEATGRTRRGSSLAKESQSAVVESNPRRKSGATIPTSKQNPSDADGRMLGVNDHQDPAASQFPTEKRTDSGIA